MGFGSYDESEQERREASSDDDENVEVSPHGEGHDGKSTFDFDESTDSMLDQLRSIKETQAEDDEATDA